MGSLKMKDGHRNMKERGKLPREPRGECSKGRRKVSHCNKMSSYCELTLGMERSRPILREKIAYFLSGEKERNSELQFPGPDARWQ